MKLSQIILPLISLLLQGHHGMQPADEAAHVRRVVEHLIPHTSGQTETRFDPELQSVFTPSAQQGLVGHSNGGHIVIDVIGDSSPSITRPADFRQLDFETGAHEAQETPARQIVSFAERSGLNQRTVQVSGENREKASLPDNISSNVRGLVNPRIQNTAQSTTVVQPISQIPEAQVWRALAIFVCFISMIIPFNMLMGQMRS
ncbi:hypothetical protein PGT21_020519 [Puccinia graminis f. sp. tritici]|uniref:Uncharacterized protein n=1 Tax=Puccinia graminis f. sp. tritici TaxID=56615 RepID=A0A5B0QUN1_PUCGR|nr:hypothetical protein PGT21_020519 [Puccinia graminis f. sp. tritici]